MNKKVSLTVGMFLLSTICLSACQQKEKETATQKKEAEKGVYMENKPIVSNSTADMLRYIVLDNRVYWENGTLIDGSHAKELQKESLGKTHYIDTPDVNQISEVSTENLSTNISTEPEIYSIKGYDSKYKIMCSIRNEIYIFDCLSDFKVVHGKDLMSKINLVDSDIIGAVYNVNDSEKELKDLNLLKNTIQDLHEAECVKEDSASLSGNIRIELELADHTKTIVLLYKEGYIGFAGFDGVFHLDTDSYHALYESLQ